ncbi:MAG: metalloregulator ArsR/SmtB family transcription factor [bacterium]
MEIDPVKVFKALSNQSRLEILKAIYQEGMSVTTSLVAEKKVPSEKKCSCCVGDIMRKFRLAPSTISHHVRELAMAGLVRVEREGQFIRVLPNTNAMKVISDFVQSFAEEAGKKK